jgi:hypothetical protein
MYSMAYFDSWLTFNELVKLVETLIDQCFLWARSGTKVANKFDRMFLYLIFVLDKQSRIVSWFGESSAGMLPDKSFYVSMDLSFIGLTYRKRTVTFYHVFREINYE